MLRLSTLCMLLAISAAQNGYDYNRPNRPFGQGSTSSRPGTTTTPYPIRPQNDDYVGTTARYPNGNQNYPTTRPGYPGQAYPGPNGPSSPGGYPNRPPGSSNGLGDYPQSSYPQGPQGEPTSGYPGQPDSSYPPGPRGPSNGFRGPDSRYPGQGQNYPGGPNSNHENGGFDDGHYEGGDYSAIPGEPDIDYPILSYIPQTNFNCRDQPYPGYYADVETRCQVFHICANNRTYDFLCPNGTVFSQEDFVCVWWNQFDCQSAPAFFELNAKLYDYSPRDSNYPISGFNDYSGPNYNGGGPQQGPYPGSSGPQGPTTPFPTVSLTSPFAGQGYPNQVSPGSYPTTQGPLENYPGSQGPPGNYPDYQQPGQYPNSPQSPGGPGYPGSTTPYPETSSGYPSGRPNGPSFPNGSNRGRQPQKPHREYLPPRNKRARSRKH